MGEIIELIRGKSTYRGAGTAGSSRAAIAEEARCRRRRNNRRWRCRPPEEWEASGEAPASSAAEEARCRGIRWWYRPAKREASGIPEHRHRRSELRAARLLLGCGGMEPYSRLMVDVLGWLYEPSPKPVKIWATGRHLQQARQLFLFSFDASCRHELLLFFDNQYNIYLYI